LMISGGKRKPRYGLDVVFMLETLPYARTFANLTIPGERLSSLIHHNRQIGFLSEGHPTLAERRAAAERCGTPHLEMQPEAAMAPVQQ
jgi:hypothetical protein